MVTYIVLISGSINNESWMNAVLFRLVVKYIEPSKYEILCPLYTITSKKGHYLNT